MNFYVDPDLGGSLHTALRKACDSTATSAAWHGINALKTKPWKNLLKIVRQEFIGLEIPPTIPVEKDENMEWALAKKMWPTLKNACINTWEPHSEGSDAMCLYLIFKTFNDNDWLGFVSFLPYIIEKPKGKKKAKNAGA